MQDKIQQAKDFCVVKHAGQKRDNGDPYWTHPFAVADHVRDFVSYADRKDREPILIAAYLHDTLEDTDTTFEEIEKDFGYQIADIVQDLTNVVPKGTPFHEKQRMLIRHAVKMSKHAKMVKLADRLHNLLSMNDANWDEHRKERYACAALELCAALHPWPRFYFNEGEELAAMVIEEAKAYIKALDKS